MTEPTFLVLAAVLAAHDRALERHGGLPGLRDGGLLDSALMRPENAFAYRPDDGLDLFDLAASYAFGIAKNHPFNDANKRTAWSACVLFLKRNGVEIAGAAEAIVETMVALAAGDIDEPAFAAWLRTLTRT